jgi:integrase
MRASARTYFQVLVSALNKAVKTKLISVNPAIYLDSEDKKPIKAEKSKRSYLTIDELRQLIATDCKRKQVKRAFLFACFTGLRISDVKSLRWEDIKEENGNKYIEIIMQKTRDNLKLKLNNDALRWMPEGHGKGHIFMLPDNRATINYNIKTWAKAAGIDKDICFHMSRHTFATMALTLGADLYTVSKLLGHKDISVTQVYADIIDKKKEDALNLTNGLFDK